MDAAVEIGHNKPFFPNLAGTVLPMPVLTLETHEIFKGKNGQKLKASITCK